MGSSLRYVRRVARRDLSVGHLTGEHDGQLAGARREHCAEVVQEVPASVPGAGGAVRAEHATMDDAIKRLCFIAKIEEGLRQSNEGQLVSHEEVRKQFLS